MTRHIITRTDDSRDKISTQFFLLGLGQFAHDKWERRALAAMVEALVNREHGRPPLLIDPEKEALQRQSQELQAQLQVLEQTVRIRLWLEQPDKKRMRRPK